MVCRSASCPVSTWDPCTSCQCPNDRNPIFFMLVRAYPGSRVFPPGTAGWAHGPPARAPPPGRVGLANSCLPRCGSEDHAAAGAGMAGRLPRTHAGERARRAVAGAPHDGSEDRGATRHRAHVLPGRGRHARHRQQLRAREAPGLDREPAEASGCRGQHPWTPRPGARDPGPRLPSARRPGASSRRTGRATGATSAPPGGSCGSSG